MLKRNILWTVLSRYGAQGLSLVSNLLLARYLGREGFGEYAFISSILLIGNAFTNFGMDMVLIRRLSLEFDRSIFVDGLWLQGMLSLVCIVLVLTVGLIWPVPFSLRIYIFALLPLSFFSVATIALRAHQNMQIFSILQVMVAALQFLVVFMTWSFQGNITTFVVLMLAAHSIAAMVSFAPHASGIKDWRFIPSRVFALLKESAHMAVIGTLRLVYEKIPATVLPMLAGLSFTGLFFSAVRVVDAGKLGYLSAFTAIYPEMTRDGDFGKQMKGLLPMLSSAFFVSIFLSLFATQVIHILFGEDYLSAAIPLRVMAWVVVPYVLVTYTSLGLVALGYERPVLTSLLYTLAILLILLIALTSLQGLAGSAVAVLIAELFHAALLWRQWRMNVLSKLS